MMRPRYLLLAIIFAFIIAAILVLFAAGSLPPRAGAQINPPPGAQDALVERAEVQTDGNTNVTATIGPALTAAMPLQDGPSIVERYCARCHGAQGLGQIKKSPAEWEKALARMESMGVRLSDAERDVLVNYLAGDDSP